MIFGGFSPVHTHTEFAKIYYGAGLSTTCLCGLPLLSGKRRSHLPLATSA